MIALAASLLLSVPLQDADVAAWIKKLGDESIEVREEAIRNLIGKGAEILDPLKRAVKVAGDPGIKLRLEMIVDSIEKRVVLAKVLAPTRRLTTDAKPRLLKELLESLAKDVGVTLSMPDLDPGRQVEIELKGATWWEALDQVARVAGLTYSFSRTKKTGLELKVALGKRIDMPVTYVEQFRVGLAESKRYLFEAPGRSRNYAQVVLGILPQPNLVPADEHIDVEFTSAVDAKGESALAEGDSWLGNLGLYSSDLGFTPYAWLRPEAAYPVTIAGTAAIDFVTEVREISLDLPDGRASFDDATLSIRDFVRTETEFRLTLEATAHGDKKRSNRLIDQRATIVGDEGKKSESWAPGMSFRNQLSSWNFKFPLSVGEPRKLTFKWQTGFHRVMIPFRIAGIRLP